MDPAVDSSFLATPPPPQLPPPPEPPITVIPQAAPPPKSSKKRVALVLTSIFILLGSIGIGVVLVGMRQKPGVDATACSDNQRWADITAEWTGDGTAKVTNSSTSCSYKIGLASYEFYSWSDQVLLDQDIKDVEGGQSVNFEVKLPNCKAQLDLFFGSEAIPANHSFPDYANKGLIKWKHVGEINCSIAPTPTPSSNTPPSCPSGTQLLFSQAKNLTVGTTVGANGQVSSLNGSWVVDTQNGPLMARDGTKMTITFPQQTLLDSVFIFDNDPKSGESPWSINGVSLPVTGQGKWGPLFHLGLTSNQMVFNNGGDSPHFNICLKFTNTPTSTPTPKPTVTPKPTPTVTPKPTTTPAVSPTPTTTPAPTVTPNPALSCQQLTASIGSTVINPASIQEGDIVTFRAFASATNTTVTKIRFTMTVGDIVQTPIDVTPTFVSGLYQADWIFTVTSHAAHSLNATPIHP